MFWDLKKQVHERTMNKENKHRTIGIIGTGNFAQAFACRLLQSGYDVILGSRNPTERMISNTHDCWCNIRITTVDECIKNTNTVVVAIHNKHTRDTLSPFVELLKDKIIIDVSNKKCLTKGPSYAELLQKLLSHSSVVKAFNVVSAYDMESQTSGGSHNVCIASDDFVARNTVADLARDLGFTPKDYGVLWNARKIEKMPLQLFPEWKFPIGFTFLVFIIWYLYVIFIYFVEKTSYSWEQIFVKVTNKPLCMTALTILACTYLPSSIAAMFQIYNGSKHVRFPGWLDTWLRTRKQLGLIAFTLAFVHVIMSVLIMSPTYLKSWYHETEIVIPKNITTDLHFPLRTWMTWKGEAACLTGIIAFLGLCILAVTSIKSVGDQLNWREWRCIQSKLGHVVLLLSLCHVIVMGSPYWIKAGPLKTVRSITFLSSVLPIITLFLKLCFSLPVLSGYVKRIRHGWERKSKRCKAKCSGFEGTVLGTKYRPIVNGKRELSDFRTFEASLEDTDIDNCQCNAATNFV